MKNPLMELTDAEDFFAYFDVPHHPEILNVSRMHILKQFQVYLKEEGCLHDNPTDPEVWKKQRELLFRAYRDFLQPTPLRQKFFPEFYRRNGEFVPFHIISRKEEAT
ncbi:nitrogenase-stabilizing/protective protein [Evansella caseinilytica]|uniref:Nitrogenase-stabilizing/protective protein n=1 Tax=Evansella caseinilytica TaxID=1503961 RepID=A0A1H3I9P4_9BACI|nr:nitrogenase-stabilizing/protective protein NifW [Evansella caseinilytica]SDY24400.1 nitrogenase-stabilizing/protective protein [Evansella caseinilytica]